MKTSKKAIGMFALLLCLLSIGACYRSESFGPNRYHDHKGHSWFYERGIDRVMDKMDNKVKDLNLNDEQQKKYEILRSKLKEDLSGMGHNRKAFHMEIKDEIDREEPDMTKVAGLLKHKVGHVEERVTAHIDLWLEFYLTLDEAQKAKVIESLRDRMEGCGG